MNFDISFKDEPIKNPTTPEGMCDQMEDFMGKAKGLLGVDHCLHPVLFSFEEDGFVPHMINLDTEEDKDATRDLMQTLAKTPGCLGIGILMDAYARSISKGEEFPEGSVKDMPGSFEAITCLLHTPEATYFRQMPYLYDKDRNQYSYSDSGWEKTPATSSGSSRFENPFNR